VLTENRISEIIREKKFQSRAFLLLPMTFNIGVIIGPILGGVLSDPAASYPGLFGKVALFTRFPYVLPNLVSAVFLFFAALMVWLGLEETHHMLLDQPPDLGLRIGARLASLFRRLYWGNWGSRSRSRSGSMLGPYESVPTEDIEMPSEAAPAKSNKKKFTQTLPFRRIFTRNMTMTLITHFVFTLHIGTYNSLYYVFLSTPVWDPKSSEHARHLPFRFTGGLGLQPREVGIAMAILGVIGISMQLFLYPTISKRLGTVVSWRTFLICFPVVYSIMPFLAMVPSTSPPPEGKTGVLVWAAIAGLLFILVSGRTISLPANVILINNNSPHPSVLGTVHGLGQSVSSGARTIGPLIAGWLFGYGLDHGIVGLVWWLLALIAGIACLASLLVREGDGHEIWLEGDEVEA
jgi:MFS family permease